MSDKMNRRKVTVMLHRITLCCEHICVSEEREGHANVINPENSYYWRLDIKSLIVSSFIQSLLTSGFTWKIFALYLSPATAVQVNYVPVSVMITAFKKECVKRPLEGFGVLVPSKEQENGLKTLGK